MPLLRRVWPVLGALWLGGCGNAASSSETPTIEVSGSAAVLQSVPPQPRPSSSAVDETPARWLDDVAQARSRSARQGRLLVMFATADWTAAARQMERAWAHPQVTPLLRGAVLLRLDLTNTSAASQERADRLGVQVVPSVVVTHPGSGQQLRHEGLLDGPALAEFLRDARARLEAR